MLSYHGKTFGSQLIILFEQSDLKHEIPGDALVLSGIRHLKKGFACSAAVSSIESGRDGLSTPSQTGLKDDDLITYLPILALLI